MVYHPVPLAAKQYQEHIHVTSIYVLRIPEKKKTERREKGKRHRALEANSRNKMRWYMIPLPRAVPQKRGCAFEDSRKNDPTRIPSNFFTKYASADSEELKKSSQQQHYYYCLPGIAYCKTRQRYALPCCSLGATLIRACTAIGVVEVGVVRVNVKSSVGNCQSEQKQVTNQPNLGSSIAPPPCLLLGNIGVPLCGSGDLCFRVYP